MERTTAKKICFHCGREYETTAGNSKYCSVLCAAAEAKRKRAQWCADNKDYYKKYRKRRKAVDFSAVYCEKL